MRASSSESVPALNRASLTSSAYSDALPLMPSNDSWVLTLASSTPTRYSDSSPAMDEYVPS